MRRKPHPLSGGIPEPSYRASRIARILGNPTAFKILELMTQKHPLRPSEIARAIRRSIVTVSEALAKLRNIDLVRYYRSKGQALYDLKYARATLRFLSSLMKLTRETFSDIEHAD